MRRKFKQSIERLRRFLAGVAVCSRDLCPHRPAGSGAPTNCTRRSHGWLHRSPNVLAHDVGTRSLSRRLHTLSLFLVAACLLSSFLILPTIARASSNPSYDAAMANCNAYSLAAQYPGLGVVSGESCVDGPMGYGRAIFKAGTIEGVNSHSGTQTDNWALWDYTGSKPDVNPCSGMSSSSIYQSGRVLEGSSTCVRGPVQDDGSQAMCGVNLNPISPPTWNPSHTDYETYVSFTPTGSVCGEGSGDSPGLISGPANPSSPPPPASPPPPIPDPVPPDNPNPPNICGELSCYDTGNDGFCATSGGQKFCVPGDTGRSAGGGCASSNGSTICAGSPVPPQPPPPPASPITNPALQANGFDSTTQANPVTGVPQTVVTTVYTSTGGTVSSGQRAGDSGPATTSGGSSGGGSGSGSGDGSGEGDAKCTAGALCDDKYVDAPCGSTPVTAGDPLLGSIARDMHAVRCAPGNQSLNASDFDGADKSLGTDHTVAEVTAPDTSSVDPMASLDASGFLGHGSCPGFAPIMYMDQNILKSDGICATADLLSKYILAMAYAFAALIIARIKAGG